MHLIQSALVCLPFLAVAPAPEPKDVQSFLDALETHPRLPLVSLVSGQAGEDSDRAPLIAIGRLPAGAMPPAPLRARPSAYFPGALTPLPADELLHKYATGKEQLLAPSADDATWLILVGPRVNSLEWCDLSRVTRQGKTITIRMDTFTDNGDRKKNSPHRAVHALKLGNLEAGEYDVRVVWRKLMLDVEKEDTHYRWNEVLAGRLKVEVNKASAKADAATPALLQEGDFHKGTVPEGEGIRDWRRSASWSVPLQWDMNRNRLPKLGLRVGTFDLVKWLESKPRTDQELPTLNKPVKGSPVYALVLGPSLNSGEWTTVREVEWKKDKDTKVIVLRVEVWRDDGERLRNVPHLPLLVVPVDESSPGDYRVEVEWYTLRAQTSRDPYRPEDPTKPNKIAELMKGVSSQEFTLVMP